MDHDSFIFNPEIAKILVGEWNVVDQPESVVIHFLKDKRLYGKELTNNHQWEIFGLPENKLVDSDTDYATIVQENGETILKYNSLNFKKKD